MFFVFVFLFIYYLHPTCLEAAVRVCRRITPITPILCCVAWCSIYSTSIFTAAPLHRSNQQSQLSNVYEWHDQWVVSNQHHDDVCFRSRPRHHFLSRTRACWQSACITPLAWPARRSSINQPCVHLWQRGKREGKDMRSKRKRKTKRHSHPRWRWRRKRLSGEKWEKKKTTHTFLVVLLGVVAV